MCGIAGVLILPGRSLPGNQQIRSSLEGMTGALDHRGPDDRGICIVSPAAGSAEVTCAGAPTVGLAHTRLAILDLTPAGHQPMQDTAAGNWITHNGEIYNFKELRDELAANGERLALSDVRWRSRTDTEVILRAYAKWGKECLVRLSGMFAFGIWDAQRQALFLARDRLGIKPLYYYVGDGFFLFASEVRALLASGLVPRRMDPVALWQYLSYQSVPAPRTLIEGVRALQPGSCLTVDSDGKITNTRYWDLLKDASPEARGSTGAESIQRVRQLLREALRLHLVSDVPVGVFLSGGIDSSALVLLMAEAGRTPRTFSVVFTEGAYDEARYARQVAERFNTEHTEILLREGDLLDQLPDALSAMDQPTGDGVNSYLISRAVRGAGMKVALSGLGGDEFFGGYSSFARLGCVARPLRLWGRAPATLRAMTASFVRMMGRSTVPAVKAAAMIETDGTLASVFPVMRHVLSVQQRRALLTERWLRLVGDVQDPYVQLLRQSYARGTAADLFARISYGEARTYMHDVLLRDTDQMSMAHGLEVRVPLLDHKLLEYVIGLPEPVKRSNGVPKRLLVECLGDLLPERVVYRPKQGFTLPFDPWMRGALRGFCEHRLSSERIGSQGIFRPNRIEALWTNFLSGRRDVSWSRLWILVVLEEWLERNEVECEPSQSLALAMKGD